MAEQKVTPVFCTKCHKLVNILQQDSSGSQFAAGDRSIGAKFRGFKFHNKLDKVVEGFPAYCPAGHEIRIKDTPEQKEEEAKLDFRFGSPCPYHHRDGAICDQRKSCEECIVFKNRGLR